MDVSVLAVVFTWLLLPNAVFARQVPQVAGGGTYQWAGCWNMTNVLNGRATFPGKPWQSTNMTIENCVTRCGDPAYGGPFNYAGITDGNKCYCANETYQDRLEFNSAPRCNTPCSGATKSETCGGNVLVEMYSRIPGRTAKIVDLPYFGEGFYTAGCYNYYDLEPYMYMNLDLFFDSIQTCAFYCKWWGNPDGPPNRDFYAFAMGENGLELDTLYSYGVSCHCFKQFDFSKLTKVPLSYCNRTCEHLDAAGDQGQICGGYPPNLLLYSNNTVKDFERASKATSRTLWSSSVLAASTSRYTARSSASLSKSGASSSRSSARSRVSSSQASASASRSTRLSSVNSSKTSASLSRSTARSVRSTSQSSASSSRSSARSRVSASTSSAASAKTSRSQSLSRSKSSYLSRYTSSSLSRQSALADYTSRSLSSSLSRSTARSLYSSRSLSAATSKSVNSASLSSSRSLASSSRSSVNAAQASSYTSNSLSLSQFYSSRSYSISLASSSRSSASAAGNPRARYGEVISVTTTIIVDTSSSDVPLTDTDSVITTTTIEVSTDDATYTITTTSVTMGSDAPEETPQSEDSDLVMAE